MAASPLSPRDKVAFVWTGTQAIVWGGSTDLEAPSPTYYADGAVFTP